MHSLRLFPTLVLAIWLGTYAFRSYVPSAVWNLSDELPFHLKGLFAVATHMIGLAGAVIVLKWRRRTLQPLAIAFAAATVARQAFAANDAIGPYLALLSWPLWLWFMAALADEISASDSDALIAPAFAAAIALQLGMQSAWHGLDLASVRGLPAAAVAVVLAGLLVFNTIRLQAPVLARPHSTVSWLLIGPALFLEMTLVGNVGRVSQITGWPVLTTTIALQISLLGGIVIATRYTRLWQRMAVIVLGFIALFAVPGVTGTGGAILYAVQLVIIAGLHEGAERRVRWSAATMFTLSALLFFGLIFVFYNAYELPPLWLLAYAPLAVACGLAQRAGAWPSARAVTWLAAACALAVLYLIPPPPMQPRNERELTVMTYNIHHGFDDRGVPGMQNTASEIANANADLVALQEIGRGWTLLGGNDLIGYLRWRFPQYALNYTPINGQLWGLAIMSRLQVDAADGEAFEAEPGSVRYGWSGVVVRAGGRKLWFYGTHVTPDLVGPAGDARFAQTATLQHLTSLIRPVIIAGDFNAHPQDPPIVSMARAFSDLGANAGLGELETWPAGKPNERIDYIFGRGVTVAGGSIPRTPASDHLPVVVRVRFDDTTTLR
ncbi:MAG TPA: endonuclease/exonuclease/phosphatase family protein [Longimicrobiales bacterium]